MKASRSYGNGNDDVAEQHRTPCLKAAFIVEKPMQPVAPARRRVAVRVCVSLWRRSGSLSLWVREARAHNTGEEHLITAFLPRTVMHAAHFAFQAS